MSKLIWLLAVASGSAAFVLGASRQNIPDAAFWSTRQSWIFWALAATFLFAPFADYSREGWDGLSEEARFGLTYDDFVALRGKYGIVAAVPIVKDDQYVGCITADMPPFASGAQGPDQQQVLESLATTAALVAHVLKD